MTTNQKKPIFVSTINKETWHVKKNILREKYPTLTDPDLDFEDGNVTGLIERVHSKIGKAIGKSKEGLHKFIEAL